MLRLATLLFALSLSHVGSTPVQAADTKPLRALLIAGGCCHDYAKQHELLSQGIQARAHVQVDVVWTDDKSVTPNFPFYEKADWAAGYDIVIHDECAAGVKDMALVKRILDTHKTVPSINLHCAMHSFRTGTDVWFKHLGLQSNSHGPQEPIAIQFVDKEHPITKSLADWTTIKEELYNNTNMFDAHPLAMGKQIVKQKDGTTKAVEYIVAWTNEKSGARSFSTTIGHNNDTVADARYLDLVTRGLLWACDKLKPEYQTPFKGQGKVTFIKATPKPETPKPAAMLPPVAPKDATLVAMTASSEETGKNNFAWRAIDGDENTRWCASNADYPQWLQLELDQPRVLAGLTMTWENNGVYQYNIESSTNGKTWNSLVDAAKNEKPAPYSHEFKTTPVKFLRINALNKKSGGWASIREVKLQGQGLRSIAPKMSTLQKAVAEQAAKADADPYKTEGNIAPKIVKLTAAEEQKYLADVKVAEGFEATLFAPPQTANYPVFVAAAPDGTLYVSSDGNGSLGRNPKRGRILRLRDRDNDGRADEVKEFVKGVDSPRGLVWDHDRLYLVHPPHLSAFIDKDGDGVSDEQKVLVKNIAFGFDKRPADHTTNGLSLGIDGWLYIAGGDFGFMNAEGTDGRKLTHRGGGVIRVRPDGTNLEIYSTGTRNILEVAISPLMDIFARDNTNDGGGWNVRFHHFTGLDDHGYPRLYKNFPEECIAPLADYGGGSGCGAVYVDEPGFGEAWNNAPFTADWGTGALYKHSVKPKGATFEEIRPPEPFIKMTRPTDADVDAMSRVYCASWKGATFNWEGPDVGYIVCVKPKGFKPEPLPDFIKASDNELVKMLESPSHRRRLEAQRELLRRPWSPDMRSIVSMADGKAVETRSPQTPAMQAAAAHAFMQHPGKDVPLMVGPFATKDTVESLVATSRGYWVPSSDPQGTLLRAGSGMGGVVEPALHARSVAAQIHESLRWKRPAYLVGLEADDPVIAHMVIQAASRTSSAEKLFEAFDSDRDIERLSSSPNAEYRERTLHMIEARRRTSLRVLARMHSPETVTGLIDRLAKATDISLRHGILSTLCRLHFKEGEWTGDSWGTRPDTRGPYYQPEAWSETPRIIAALKDTLAKAAPEEAAFLVTEMNRNRIQSNDAMHRILVLAKQDEKLIPEAAAQLANADSVPADGIPLLLQALTSGSANVLANAISALAKTDSAEGAKLSLAALATLTKIKDAGKELETARTNFFSAPKLENHHQLLEAEAEKVSEPTARWADMALLALSQRKGGSPESRELSQKALDHGWADAKRRAQIIEAVRETKTFAWSNKLLDAVTDPDAKVAKAAQNAVKQLKLQPKAADKSPLISTMKPEQIIAQVMKMKGDVSLGEQLFTKQTCAACHTTKESEAPKGPYLGNIAQTYKRADLAQNILDPNKTIAQGFASEVITMKDGVQQMGFITLESAENIKLRNVAAQEFTFATKDIKDRQKLPISIMPPGLVNGLTIKEFASLVDYLEALAKKK